MHGNYLAIKVLLADQRVEQSFARAPTGPSRDNNYAIRLASENGHLDVVKLLLEDKRRETKVSPAYAYAVDPSDRGNGAIQRASENGHLDVVKLLLADKRVDPADRNNYAIMLASWNNHPEVVKLLLADKRVDPSADNNEAILKASENGHLEVVKVLLANKQVDPSDYGNYAILLASSNGHAEVVKLLLGSDKINLGVKTRALKELQLKCSSSKLSHDMNYDNIEKLSMGSLSVLIRIGNQNLQDRKIIMTKSALAESAKAGYTLV